jgi:hypothetical protein
MDTYMEEGGFEESDSGSSEEEEETGCARYDNKLTRDLWLP